jgi:hypothetical protein
MFSYKGVKMEHVHPVWVGVLMTIMTGVGAMLPKIREWLKGKKEQEQSEIDFIIKNYRQRDLDQTDKLAKLEAKLLEVQQRVLDMQTAHITTLTENVLMEQKITALEREKNENSAEIVKLKAANTLLRSQVEDLERRIPK